jgi:alkanesulfonate monooxygenase SsuD/methylene tetrahydromethanopterin reductase-like flavin-dependent oxidoreductase (luciferase family)
LITDGIFPERQHRQASRPVRFAILHGVWSAPPDATFELAGSPGEVLDKLGRYAEHGVDRFYLQVLDITDPDHLRLVAEEVLPHAPGRGGEGRYPFAAASVVFFTMITARPSS